MSLSLVSSGGSMGGGGGGVTPSEFYLLVSLKYPTDLAFRWPWTPWRVPGSGPWFLVYRASEEPPCYRGTGDILKISRDVGLTSWDQRDRVSSKRASAPFNQRGPAPSAKERQPPSAKERQSPLAKAKERQPPSTKEGPPSSAKERQPPSTKEGPPLQQQSVSPLQQKRGSPL